MNFKMTKAEVQALEQVLAEIIGFQHFALEDKLLVCILTKFYQKLVIKLLNLKNKYSIKMDEPTEMAFFLYFQGEEFNPVNFNDNLVKTICDNIQKKYA